jgi:hypothetical protein
MKKLLVIALSVAMILAFAAVSMAEATFSGEIDAGYKAYSPDQGKDQSMPYIFGKMVLSGKLGDSVTGTLVFKDADDDINATGNATAASDNVGKFAIDEASLVFAQSFGSIKVGYFGWNNNLKDIIDTYRGDVKTDVVVSGTVKVVEGLTIGAAYAIPTTDDNGKTDGKNAGLYGIDLGYATDAFGADLIYTNSSGKLDKKGKDLATVTGVQGYYKLGDLKPYIQYEVVSDTGTKDDLSNTIIGAIYESANSPIYGRVEYDLSAPNDIENEYGVRLGYKLASGAKLEAQHYYGVSGKKDSREYVKVICAF